MVAKLFTQTLPDLAIFGEKDYQQLRVVKQMTHDLDLQIEVVGAPTIREEDGLALSSRNVYLSSTERTKAPLLYQVLNECADVLRGGAMPQAALQSGRARLERDGFAVDYLEWRAADTLLPATNLTSPSRLLAAAKIGATRLIDNIAV